MHRRVGFKRLMLNLVHRRVGFKQCYAQGFQLLCTGMFEAQSCAQAGGFEEVDAPSCAQACGF